MKPLVHHKHMTVLTPAEQKKVCRCSKRCEMFVIISYTRGPVLTMCETETKKYIAEVLKGFGLDAPVATRVYRPWEPEEIEILKAHYKEYAGRYGYAKELSRKMNRTPQQIADKAKYLKLKGEL